MDEGRRQRAHRLPRQVLVAALAALVAAAAAAERVREIPLTLLTGTPATLPTTRLLADVFIPEVDRRLAERQTGWRIRWRTAFGTVAEPDTMLEALRAGVGDVGTVITPFEPSKLSLYLVSYVTPFSAREPEEVERAIAATAAAVPAFASHWHTYDLHPLTRSVSHSYQLFTTFPVRSIEDLEGRKIAGPSATATWLGGVGAVHVQDESANYYNSVKTGVYDGFLFLLDLAWVLKLYEAAPWVTVVDFGPTFLGGLAVNRRVWLELPASVRRAFEEAALVYEGAADAAQEALLRRARAGLARDAAGVHVLSAAERARWARSVPDVASLWVDRLQRYGLPGQAVLEAYMTSLRDQDAEVARHWDGVGGARREGPP